MIKMQPSFDLFKRILKGESKPERVHIIEFGIDEEVISSVTKNLLGEDMIVLRQEELVNFWAVDTDRKKDFWKKRIEFYKVMGYDSMVLGCSWQNMPNFPFKQADDPSVLSRGRRNWIDESKGNITSWEDFEKIPWKDIRTDLPLFEYFERKMPEGMKLMINTSLFEMVLENFLGYEGLFFKLHDDPELVGKIFEVWGQKVYEFYQTAIQFNCVGGIFHSDDMGFKTGTFLSPQDLRKLVFPWFRQYAALAHKYDKMFWLHSCGNLREVMEDIIEYIKIDAFHSFQDVVMPVTEFKKKYGSRIAALGGVDVDKLARLPEKELRTYVRTILAACVSEGRFAIGSGNTVTNYVPPENYLIMREEALNWVI